jgi:hypothetical protein
MRWTKTSAALWFVSGVVLTMLLAVGAVTTSWAQQSRRTQTQPKQTEPRNSSLTGCIDEESGRYILVDDRELQPIADLEAEGFPNEGFAKYLGHKVTVDGSQSPGGGRLLFKVRKIVSISETCAPQPEHQLR